MCDAQQSDPVLYQRTLSTCPHEKKRQPKNSRFWPRSNLDGKATAPHTSLTAEQSSSQVMIAADDAIPSLAQQFAAHVASVVPFMSCSRPVNQSYIQRGGYIFLNAGFWRHFEKGERFYNLRFTGLGILCRRMKR